MIYEKCLWTAHGFFVRLLLVLFVFFAVFSGYQEVTFADAEGNAPSRTINLVYDDSGSMIVNDKGEYVDTWCQAKYAVEVFAGMLGDNDTMNVYVMSDFENGVDGNPKLVLKGRDGAEKNVSEVHNMVTVDGNTPFNAVRAAEAALESTKADEKWLVVLTDGEFEDGKMPQSEIDSFFAGKPSDIKVMYLGMGPAAGAIKANPDNNIYYEKAQNNNEILNKLTDIGTQVFNRDRLKVGSGNTISFDIPMKQLIVFAQGKDVSIKGISSDDTMIEPSGSPVSVKYSEKATASNHFDNKKIKIDKSLKGSLATFDKKFKAGKYKVDVSGAKTVEVYYQPDVDVIASLRQGDKEVTDLSDLEAGDYVIDFALVKSGTQKKIKDSKLLGDVSYEAVVTNNGTTHDRVYTSGDTITIEEGPLTIDAVAHYLGYHTVQTHLDYSIYKNKTVSFENADNEAQVLTSKGFDKDKPMNIKVAVDGADPSSEQWKEMTVPEVVSKADKKYRFGEFRVEKSDEPGVYNVYPTFKKNKPAGVTYEDSEIEVSYESKFGSETWSGNDILTMKITDKRSFFERHRRLIMMLIGLLILLIILAGYTPIKKRLPRSIKAKPVVKCRHDYEDPHDAHAKFKKNPATVFLPYIAEIGDAKIAGKRFALKGTRGGRRIVLTNASAFLSKDVKINNKRIKDYGKKVEFGPGSEIVIVADDGWRYTCQLSVTDKKPKRGSRKRKR